MLHQDKVFQEIATIMDCTHADQNTHGWFKHCMTAIGRVWRNMTDEEKCDVISKKEEMSKNGFPEDERPR